MTHEYEYCNCEQAQSLRAALKQLQKLLENGTIPGTLGLVNHALSLDDRSKDLFLQDERANYSELPETD